MLHAASAFMLINLRIISPDNNDGKVTQGEEKILRKILSTEGVCSPVLTSVGGDKNRCKM